jgi:hypothetical protein
LAGFGDGLARAILSQRAVNIVAFLDPFLGVLTIPLGGFLPPEGGVRLATAWCTPLSVQVGW